MSELRALRQRKDELETHLATLQDSRRQLMVQLEGLMKMLKVFQIVLAHIRQFYISYFYKKLFFLTLLFFKHCSIDRENFNILEFRIIIISEFHIV